MCRSEGRKGQTGLERLRTATERRKIDSPEVYHTVQSVFDQFSDFRWQYVPRRLVRFLQWYPNVQIVL